MNFTCDLHASGNEQFDEHPNDAHHRLNDQTHLFASRALDLRARGRVAEAGEHRQNTADDLRS